MKRDGDKMTSTDKDGRQSTDFFSFVLTFRIDYTWKDMYSMNILPSCICSV